MTTLISTSASQEASFPKIKDFDFEKMKEDLIVDSTRDYNTVTKSDELESP
mgnify:CR=1 FL=1